MSAAILNGPRRAIAPLRPPPRPPEGIIETKDATARIDVLAGTAGVFEGYASLFGIVDLGRDMVMPGAFARSLAQRGVSGIRMLWQHDPGQPIGAWTSIREDARGLHVRGRLNLAVNRAREIHALLQQGAVDGLSIGFKTQTALSEPRTGIRRLTQVDLWEISLVTFPLLPQARVAAVKGGTFRAFQQGPRQVHAPARSADPLTHLAAAIRRAAIRLHPQKDHTR